VTSPFVRLNAVILALSLLLLIGSKLIGQNLPPAPLISGIILDGQTAELRVLDAQHHIAYGYPFTKSNPTYAPGNCQVAFTNEMYQPEHGEITILNLPDGRSRAYSLEGRIIEDDLSRTIAWSADGHLFAAALETKDETEVIAVIDILAETVRYLPVPDTGSDMPMLLSAWSPDNTRLVYVGLVSYVLEVTSGETHFLEEASQMGWQWSADGRYTVVSQNAPIIVDTLTGTPNFLNDRVFANLFEAGTGVWSPAGNVLAFQGRPADGNQFYGYRFDAGTNTLTPLLPLNLPEQRPVWSPDGKWLIYFSRMNNRFLNTYIVDSRNGNLFDEVETQQFNEAVWSPDSRYLLMVGLDVEATIHMLDMHTRQRLKWHPPSSQFIARPQWFPDSRQFSYITSRGGTDSEVHIARIDGDEIHLTARYQDVGIAARLCFPEASA
jgi:WD40 repeat protein